MGILGPRQDQKDQDPHRSPHLVTPTSWHILSPPDPQGTAPGPRGGTHVRPHGEAHPGPAPHGKAQSATPTSRRMHFSVTSRRPGGVEQPPARLRGTMENGPTGQMRSSNPPARLRGGLRQDPQISVWSLTSRKDAVWAEGLADGEPWARPGHHQAANGGLRRCRELRVDFACR